MPSYLPLYRKALIVIENGDKVGLLINDNHIDLFKANESMKPMKLIQTPHQENTYNMSPYVSQHGIPAQMEINEVVSLLSSSPRKFNFLSEAPFIYELITMTLLATLKVHCPLCLKIIRCKLLLCHYIKHNKIVLYLAP